MNNTQFQPPIEPQAKKKKHPILIFAVIAIVIIAIALIAGVASGDSGDSSDAKEDAVPATSITYQKVDLQAMLDELDSNALRAEQTYQNKYVEVTGKIANFDSDGAYISIEPVNASEWNFDTVQCYIKNDSQRNFLMNKSKGDVVTIQGKITQIGELLGYSMQIDSVQ